MKSTPSKPNTRKFTVRIRWLLLIVMIIIVTVAGVLLYHQHHANSANTAANSSNPNSAATCKTNCSVEVVPASFPNASDSGVPSGVNLTPYTGSLMITKANTTIDDKLVRGCMTVAAANVTIENSRIVCDKAKQNALDIGSKQASNVLVEHTTVIGSGVANVGVNGSNFTLSQLDISGSHDGIHLGSNDTVKDSYVHDLSKLDGIHSDSVQVVNGNSASNDLFDHDTFLSALPNNVRLNSAFHVGANLNQNFVIENSYLDGGSFTMQFDPKLPANHNIVIENNAFGRDCNDGLYDGGSSVTFTGNYWADNHQPATADNSKHGGCTGKSN